MKVAFNTANIKSLPFKSIKREPAQKHLQPKNVQVRDSEGNCRRDVNPFEQPEIPPRITPVPRYKTDKSIAIDEDSCKCQKDDFDVLEGDAFAEKYNYDPFDSDRE